MKQLELFPDFQPPRAKSPQLMMDATALQKWKQRIFDCQQSAASPAPQQQTLFDLPPNKTDPDAIDPFALQLYNLSVFDRPDWGDRVCLYFAIDNAFPLLLYVGRDPVTKLLDIY